MKFECNSAYRRLIQRDEMGRLFPTQNKIRLCGLTYLRLSLLSVAWETAVFYTAARETAGIPTCRQTESEKTVTKEHPENSKKDNPCGGIGPVRCFCCWRLTKLHGGSANSQELSGCRTICACFAMLSEPSSVEVNFLCKLLEVDEQPRVRDFLQPSLFSTGISSFFTAKSVLLRVFGGSLVECYLPPISASLIKMASRLISSHM